MLWLIRCYNLDFKLNKCRLSKTHDETRKLEISLSMVAILNSRNLLAFGKSFGKFHAIKINPKLAISFT